MEREDSGIDQPQGDLPMSKSSGQTNEVNLKGIQEVEKQEQEEARVGGNKYKHRKHAAPERGEVLNHLNVQQLLDKLVEVARQRKENSDSGEEAKSD